MFTCDVRALAQTDALRATETGRWTRSAEPAQNRKEGPTDTRDPRDARGGPTVLRMRAAGRRARAGEGGAGQRSVRRVTTAADGRALR